MRAVRARLAALTAGLAAFLAAVLPVWPAGFTAFVPDLAGVFVFCAGFFFTTEGVCPAGLVVDPPVDSPATGDTINKNESKPAKMREACSETEVGEDASLISSL